MGPLDPIETMGEVLAHLDATVEDLTLLGESSRNESIKLGALKARMAAMERRVELLQVCGALPRFRRWNQEIQAKTMSRLVLDTLATQGAPEELLDALLEALEAHLRRTGDSPERAEEWGAAEESGAEESDADFIFAG